MNRPKNLELGGVLNKILLITFALFVVVIGGWFLFFRDKSHTSNPAAKAEADHFVAFLVAKNANSSYDLLTDETKALVSKDDWSLWINLSFDKASGKPTFVEELPVTDPGKTYGEGTTVVRFVYSFTIDKTKYKAPLVLVQKNNTWKVSEIGEFQK